MQADVTGSHNILVQTQNGEGRKFFNWEDIDSETVVNLNFWNI